VAAVGADRERGRARECPRRRAGPGAEVPDTAALAGQLLEAAGPGVAHEGGHSMAAEGSDVDVTAIGTDHDVLRARHRPAYGAAVDPRLVNAAAVAAELLEAAHGGGMRGLSVAREGCEDQQRNGHPGSKHRPIIQCRYGPRKCASPFQEVSGGRFLALLPIVPVDPPPELERAAEIAVAGIVAGMYRRARLS
jgi:hypothetical protein